MGKLDPTLIERIRVLALSGHTCPQIAQILGIHRNTAWKYRTPLNQRVTEAQASKTYRARTSEQVERHRAAAREYKRRKSSVRHTHS